MCGSASASKTEVTIRLCCKNREFEKKTLPKALNFSDSIESIPRQIQPSFKKNMTTSLSVCTVYFCGSYEMSTLRWIFGLSSQCLKKVTKKDWHSMKRPSRCEFRATALRNAGSGSRKRWQQAGATVNQSFFLFLYLPSFYSTRLCVPSGWVSG